jgi:hypothetical protein
MWLVLPRLSGTLAGSPTTRGETCFQGMATTAFLEKGEPFQERSPQHSVSTKGLELCASQPRGPFSLKTALIDLVREACAKEANSPSRYGLLSRVALRLQHDTSDRVWRVRFTFDVLPANLYISE